MDPIFHQIIFRHNISMKLTIVLLFEDCFWKLIYLRPRNTNFDFSYVENFT